MSHREQDDLFKINYSTLNGLNTGIVRLNKKMQTALYIALKITLYVVHSLYKYRHKQMKIMGKDTPC